MSNDLQDLKENYRRTRAPDALHTELLREYEARSKPRWSAPVVAFASFALVAATAMFVVMQPQPDAAGQIAQAQVAPSPSVVTAYTGELGQLSVSRLSLPAKPDLSGVTSVPALPSTPAFPTTL